MEICECVWARAYPSASLDLSEAADMIEGYERERERERETS